MTDLQTIAASVPSTELPQALSILRLLRTRRSIIVRPSAKAAAEALRLAGLLEMIGPDQYRIPGESKP